MHCSAIRLSLYHYQDETTGKLQVNANLKNLFKAQGFKWKTVTNDSHSGSRVEIMECQNTKFKEQISPLSCTLFRAGLQREDVHKEPFSFKINSFLALSSAKPHVHPSSNIVVEAQSACGLLNSVMQYKRSAPNGEQLVISDINGNSEVKSVMATELMLCLNKAEKLKRGNFCLPESTS